MGLAVRDSAAIRHKGLWIFSFQYIQPGSLFESLDWTRLWVFQLGAGVPSIWVWLVLACLKNSLKIGLQEPSQPLLFASSRTVYLEFLLYKVITKQLYSEMEEDLGNG